MTATAFVTVQGIVSYQFTHCDEVIQTDSLVEFYVHTFFVARDEEVGFEFLADFFHLLQSFFQSFGGTSHTDIFPHYVTQFLVDGIY